MVFGRKKQEEEIKRVSFDEEDEVDEEEDEEEPEPPRKKKSKPSDHVYISDVFNRMEGDLNLIATALNDTQNLIFYLRKQYKV